MKQRPAFCFLLQTQQSDAVLRLTRPGCDPETPSFEKKPLWDFYRPPVSTEKNKHAQLFLANVKRVDDPNPPLMARL